MNRVVVGSRKSPLALIQVEETIQAIQKHHPDINIKRETFDTAGDKDLVSCLVQGVTDDFFTNTLDQALLNDEIDVAVHSAKDLPQKLHPDLCIAALTTPKDDSDAWVGRYDWHDLPQGARIGTSSPLRQEQVLQHHPDATIVTIRGTIQQRLDLIKNNKVDGIIVATCAMQRLNLENNITNILPWEGFPLQGQLAVVCRQSDSIMRTLFKSIDARQHYGDVYLVGAGPGDPDLITMKGVSALKKADCVLYDYLTDKKLLDYAPNADHIYVGKRKGEHCLTQSALCRLILDHARSGKTVVRLKGGDPFIFGRGADELRYLKNYHIRTHIIPGISAGTGLATQLGLPLTARGLSSSVAFVSGHGEDEKTGEPKEITFPHADTLVFFMGMTKLNFIVNGLEKRGWDMNTPVLVISNGTRDNELLIKGTLETIEMRVHEAQPEQPGLIIVGPTVGVFYDQQ